MRGTRADAVAARWLRQRHPEWSRSRIEHLIARTHVIEENPLWTDEQVNSEVRHRLRMRAMEAR